MIFIHFYPQKQLLGNEFAGSDTLECNNETGFTADSPATTSADEAVEPFYGILLALASCSGEEELREDGCSLLLPGQDGHDDSHSVWVKSHTEVCGKLIKGQNKHIKATFQD